MTKKTKNKKTPPPSLSQSKVEHLKNGNTEISITIPWETVSNAYQKSLASLSKTAKIKGFRPGKAPTNLVEQKLGKDKIYQEMLKNLLTQAYLEAIKTHHLLPIISPQLNLISSEEEKDWTVKATTAELPKFGLGNYKEAIRKELAPEKIWTPGKERKGEKEKKTDPDQVLSKIFATLLKTIKIDLPQVLVENEANRSLSRLIDQTGRLGMTVDQYLSSIGKTSAQIREEFQAQATESIKLELILSRIASEEKIKVSEEEVEAMIKATGDEKIQKSLQTPSQKVYIRQVLRKRKAIDILSKL
jgi:FKBP-type peptidyl-prolyl cis-trans isomerase (trigger factor)